MSALEAYEEGLKLDATNSMLLDGKKDCENRIRARSSTPSDSMMQIGALFTAPGAIDKVLLTLFICLDAHRCHSAESRSQDSTFVRRPLLCC